MKLSRLPISLCHANCPTCGVPAEFRMFESGLGGEFETYVGQRTGRVYRLDLGQVHYLGRARADLLARAEEKEELLIRAPEDIRSKVCGAALSAAPVRIDGEETTDAYEI